MPNEGVFLDRFPANYRGAIGSHFYKAIRNGAPTAAAVVEQVQAFAASRPDLQPLAAAIAADPEGAARFAEQCLARERQPAADRAARKAAAALEGQRQWMAGQPPTEKQISYLQALGCGEAPSNRLEASEWIDSRARRAE